eukprot:Lankesteria_metandrocarpae@DN4146_c1_g1_i2.p1
MQEKHSICTGGGCTVCVWQLFVIHTLRTGGICTTVYRWYMYHCVPVVYVQCVYSNDLLFTVYLWYMYSVYSNDVYLLRHAPPSNHHPPTHHHCNLCRSTVLCFVIGKTTRVNDTCQQHVSTTISQNSDSNAHHSANC